MALMAAVGLGIAVPVTLLLRGGSADEGDGPAVSAHLPGGFRLEREVRLRDLGVAVKVPTSWSTTREPSTIRLRSGDRTTALAVAAPRAAGERGAVLRSELDGIHRSFRGVSVERGFGRSVGGIPAAGAVVSARARNGTPLRILVAAASGTRHTYLVEVFSAQNAPPERLIQAQLALRTLRLRG